ncbi:MAG: magnesium and cobalt transport protein CorA [Acidimicrobiales bacterium]|nr:magnesium and cobalt transport protein CorA [Acidimicrobiales bacterium]
MGDDEPVIIDCAVYTKGERRAGDLPVDLALEAADEPDSFVWIGLYEPTPDEFEAVRTELGLHELAVEDAIAAHQRPKLEVYDEDLFVVLKTARYVDQTETVEFAEIQLFVGANYIVSVRHGEASALTEVRTKVERDVPRISCGPMGVLHAIVDRVVDDYQPVIDGLDNDMAEIEDAVFDPARPRGFDPSQRIFKLKREILDFLRNTEPFLEPLSRLVGGNVPGAHDELTSYFRDVEDHLKRVVSSVHQFHVLLSDALDANLALVTVRQNDDMRTISAWLAVGGFPTVVGAIYGMNFEHMPELEWRYGYFLVMSVMLAVCFTLYRRFKRVGWL